MAQTKSEQVLLDEISQKLDQIIAVMAISGKEQNDQIRILRDRGFDWKQIGTLVGLNPGTARMRLKSDSKGAIGTKKKTPAAKRSVKDG